MRLVVPHLELFALGGYPAAPNETVFARRHSLRRHSASRPSSRRCMRAHFPDIPDIWRSGGARRLASPPREPFACPQETSPEPARSALTHDISATSHIAVRELVRRAT